MSTVFHNRLIFVLALIALFITGCPKKDVAKKQVNLAIWGNYATTELLKKFEVESGIKVNVSNYTSNEELLAKVQAGAAGIDVAVPSDYMVSIMTKLNLLAPLDKSKIPNSSHLKPDLLKQNFDPDNTYSLPYAWSTAGIAVNRTLYKGKIASWKDVFDEPQLAGRISLLDDVREVTAAALKYHGYSVNTTNKDELKKAEETLIKLKPKIKMFRSDTVDSLVKKEVAVAQSYSTDALQAAAQSKNEIEYILPTDGGTRAIDTLVILKGSPNLAEAHALLNFLLSSEVNVNFVKTMWGGPVLVKTRDQLPENIKNNAALFPSEATLAKFESLVDLGDFTRIYDEIWTRVKTE